MINGLLEKLQKKNEEEGLFEQQISPSIFSSQTISSLTDKEYMVSPMLEVRFKFADSWKHAIQETSFLGIGEIKTSLSNKEIKAQIERRFQNYTQALVVNVDKSIVSLFGIDLVDDSEIYLVWNKPEPQVVFYTGYSELIYENLQKFLEEWVNL